MMVGSDAARWSHSGKLTNVEIKCPNPSPAHQKHQVEMALMIILLKCKVICGLPAGKMVVSGVILSMGNTDGFILK